MHFMQSVEPSSPRVIYTTPVFVHVILLEAKPTIKLK